MLLLVRCRALKHAWRGDVQEEFFCWPPQRGLASAGPYKPYSLDILGTQGRSRGCGRISSVLETRYRLRVTQVESSVLLYNNILFSRLLDCLLHANRNGHLWVVSKTSSHP